MSVPPSERSKHVSDDVLEMYLKDRLPADAISAIDDHLGSCPQCGDRLAEQDKCLWYLAELAVPQGAERRRHPRTATDDPATLQVLAPFSVAIWDVRIVDTSKEGLRVHTPQILIPGSLIRVRMRYSVACGDVRYCVPADQGFYAGVRLHDYFFSH
jgi:hypothetical protein